MLVEAFVQGEQMLACVYSDCGWVCRCVGKWYIKCTSCGGWHAHRLFQHVSRTGPDLGESLQPVSADEQLRIVKRDLALD